jgi:hypothetical protein
MLHAFHSKMKTRRSAPGSSSGRGAARTYRNSAARTRPTAMRLRRAKMGEHVIDAASVPGQPVSCSQSSTTGASKGAGAWTAGSTGATTGATTGAAAAGAGTGAAGNGAPFTRWYV